MKKILIKTLLIISVNLMNAVPGNLNLKIENKTKYPFGFRYYTPNNLKEGEIQVLGSNKTYTIVNITNYAKFKFYPKSFKLDWKEQDLKEFSLDAAKKNPIENGTSAIVVEPGLFSTFQLKTRHIIPPAKERIYYWNKFLFPYQILEIDENETDPRKIFNAWQEKENDLYTAKNQYNMSKEETGQKLKALLKARNALINVIGEDIGRPQFSLKEQ